MHSHIIDERGYVSGTNEKVREKERKNKKRQWIKRLSMESHSNTYLLVGIDHSVQSVRDGKHCTVGESFADGFLAREEKVSCYTS